MGSLLGELLMNESVCVGHLDYITVVSDTCRTLFTSNNDLHSQYVCIDTYALETMHAYTHHFTNAATTR